MEDLEITSKMVLLTDGAQVVGPLDLEITRKMFFSGGAQVEGRGGPRGPKQMTRILF